MKQLTLLISFCILLFALAGCERSGEDKSSLGTHSLTIVDTSGKKPRGGTTGTSRDDVVGTVTYSYDSANGRYRITLKNDVLTINGDKYTLSKPGSEIRIVDDRVEINGVAQGQTVPAKTEGKPQETSENGVAPEDQPVNVFFG